MGALAGVSGGAAGLSLPDSSPGAGNVDVYWMSGVMENDTACVGPLGLHPPPYYDAYDLIADDLCQGSSSTEVRMRTCGSSSTVHVTLAAHMWSGHYDDNCDYIEARTVQQPSGGLRGTYRYIHAQGPSDYWIDIVAGPSLPRTDQSIGTTTHDSDCKGGAGWTAYHVHQDARFNEYSTPNDLDPLQVIDVWNVFDYIHRWTYPLLDTDGDGFTDAAEVFMGTDPDDNCADTSTARDEEGGAYSEPLSPWPPDFNDNGFIDIGDLVALSEHWTYHGYPYHHRYDLNANGFCDIGDLSILAEYMGMTCTVG